MASEKRKASEVDMPDDSSVKRAPVHAAESIEDGRHKEEEDDEEEDEKRKIAMAVVCSSNQNRSMEAHNFLMKRGFDIKSYGSGKKVRIPGPSIDKPNTYDFGAVTYKDILDDLRSQDARLYTENGMISMLERNIRIKERPERFQDTPNTFELIITCESRVFEQVTQALAERGSTISQPVHVVNFEIKDTPESATIGALQIQEFCEALEAAEDLDESIEEAMRAIEKKHNISLLHAVAFY